ncbi:glucokinase [Thermaurantiacus sp.]
MKARAPLSAEQLPLLVADIGGTHARFAIATEGTDGRPQLQGVVRLEVADHPDLPSALQAFAETLGQPLPHRAAIAVAGPVEGGRIALTNSPWVLAPTQLADQLGFKEVQILNDFAAVAHAVQVAAPEDLVRLAGPAADLPETGVVTVVGPGTGLGVAMLLRAGRGAQVLATEAGHIDFAPLDALEDQILAHLRTRFPRVSVERVVAGPGLANIRAALAAIEGKPVVAMEDAALWEMALAKRDPLARAALERWCLSLGSIAGDLALAHGAAAVVLAGGVVPRLGRHLACSRFHARFTAKGRLARHMEERSLFRLAMFEPGLVGAAAAGLSATA